MSNESGILHAQDEGAADEDHRHGLKEPADVTRKAEVVV